MTPKPELLRTATEGIKPKQYVQTPGTVTSMNWNAVIQRLGGTVPLLPDGTLTENPAVIGWVFARIAAVVTLLWSAVVSDIIAGDMLLGIFAVSPQAVVGLLVLLPVAFVVLPLLAAASTLVVATGVWRHLVTETGRLTYPRAVGTGILISLGSHLVLTILGSGALVVGHVLGMAHLTWNGFWIAVTVLIVYPFVVTGGIIVVTLGIPLVVCVWLTRRSRRDFPDNLPPTAT